MEGHPERARPLHGPSGLLADPCSPPPPRSESTSDPTNHDRNADFMNIAVSHVKGANPKSSVSHLFVLLGLTRSCRGPWSSHLRFSEAVIGKIPSES